MEMMLLAATKIQRPPALTPVGHSVGREYEVEAKGAEDRDKSGQRAVAQPALIRKAAWSAADN